MKIGMLLLLTLTAAGCGHQRTNADYVREHHCTTDGKLKSIGGTMIVLNGQEEFVGASGKPYRTYNCPNDIQVFIDYDEEQP